MTDEAIATLNRLEGLVNRHLPSRTMSDGGAEFRSACGRYRGSVSSAGAPIWSHLGEHGTWVKLDADGKPATE